MKHHLCIFDDYTLFDSELIPFGKSAIEQGLTKTINEILDTIISKVGEDDIIMCGEGDAKRMLGRKLEDRLKREISYE